MTDTSALYYNWNKVTLGLQAKPSEIGTVRNDESNIPSVAVTITKFLEFDGQARSKTSTQIEWHTFSSLTTEQLITHHSNLYKSLLEITLDRPTILNARAIEIVKNEAVMLLRELYDSLSKSKQIKHGHILHFCTQNCNSIIYQNHTQYQKQFEFNYNWDTIDSDAKPKPKNIGTIRIGENQIPMIAIKDKNEYKWISLLAISSIHLIDYQSEMNTSLSNIFQDSKSLLNTHKIKLIECEAIQMLGSLYEKLTDIEKKKLLLKHKKSFLGATKCYSCLGAVASGDKKTCITNHKSCGGLCNECYESMGETCLACNAKQEMHCPICFNLKTSAATICKSLSCGHSVCWKCYGQAFFSGHPIMNCPLCRATFTNAKDDADAFYDSSDDEYYADDYNSDTELSEDVVAAMYRSMDTELSEDEVAAIYRSMSEADAISAQADEISDEADEISIHRLQMVKEIGELGQSQQELVILQNRFHTTDNDKILECYELMQKIREKESLISSLKLSIEQRQTELVRLHVQPEQEAVEAAFPRDFREMMYMRDV